MQNLAPLLRGPATKDLNRVDENRIACFLVVAGTLKHHRVVAINVTPVTLSRGWNLKKLRNGLDPAIKATTLILSILLSKLKTQVVRKRNIYSKGRFKDEKNP